MQIIIGFIILTVCIITGYVGHHGHLMALWQPTEFIIIGGAAFGAVVIGSGFHGVKILIHAGKALFSLKNVTRGQYLALLKLLYSLFVMSKRDGVLIFETHVEKPHESVIFMAYPEILGNPKLLSFICDNFRVIISGGGTPENLGALMDIDLDSRNDEEMHAGHIFASIADAMPAFGIVAAVLGVVVTMQAINGPPAEIGAKVGAALVGTFLGVLMAYGIFSPLNQAWSGKVKNEENLLLCIRNSLLCFARGDSPIFCIEAARRQIPPEARPTFEEVEIAVKGPGGEAPATT
ncbi:MAG: flagellar motor stator protein MotA [Candidatus Ozemobacteraceae bacterium]